MEIIRRNLDGVIEITLSPLTDDRGFFMRTYDVNVFHKFGILNNWVQENQSFSSKKGTLRGLHFQFPPCSEAKLVRCTRGSIYDVFVDLRQGSPTFSHWESILLSSINKKLIYIPRGFAHGFVTLEENSEVLYKVDNFYSPQDECGLLWNDPDLNIDWEIENPIISDKDKNNLRLKTFIKKYKAISI